MNLSHFESYLTNCYQVVTINGHRSDPFEVISGVPQGSVLGAFLFLLVVNDLSTIFIDSLPLLFVDDLKLLCNSCNFQDDLTRLYTWNLENGMLANHTKTLTFKGVMTVDCEMGTLEIVKSHEDLDLIINGNMKCVDHVNYKIFKARRCFLKLKSTIPWTTPSKSEFQLYQSVVLSVLLYGIAIWLPNLSCLIETEEFQQSCLTWAFGKKAHADIISASGILPVTYFIQLSMISFFISLCLGKCNFNIQDYVKFTIKPENKTEYV